MWHASISDPAWRGSYAGGSHADELFVIAESVLHGVGDPALGEWRERGEIAVHLRRRLTPAEAAIVGPVVDVRGTWEHEKRINRMRRYLPEGMRLLPGEALP